MSRPPDDLAQSTASDPQDRAGSFARALAGSRDRAALRLPLKRDVAAFADNLLGLLFPQLSEGTSATAQAIGVRLDAVERALDELCPQLCAVLRPLEDALPSSAATLCARFLGQLPEVYEQLQRDAAAIEAGDPAARSVAEVILAYPGFLALAFYRVAHALHEFGVPLVPRMLTEIAHSRTGIDIHPGATIGRACCIDHGTGLVIGETAVIGDEVKLYQGVTLGALSVAKGAAGTKRHPTIEDRVVIYANATVLGGDTVVGHDSIVGGNVWLTTSVPPYSLVYQTSQVRVRRVSDGFADADFVI